MKKRVNQRKILKYRIKGDFEKKLVRKGKKSKRHKKSSTKYFKHTEKFDYKQ